MAEEALHPLPLASPLCEEKLEAGDEHDLHFNKFIVRLTAYVRHTKDDFLLADVTTPNGRTTLLGTPVCIEKLPSGDFICAIERGDFALRR